MLFQYFHSWASNFITKTKVPPTTALNVGLLRGPSFPAVIAVDNKANPRLANVDLDKVLLQFPAPWLSTVSCSQSPSQSQQQQLCPGRYHLSSALPHHHTPHPGSILAIEVNVASGNIFFICTADNFTKLNIHLPTCRERGVTMWWCWCRCESAFVQTINYRWRRAASSSQAVAVWCNKVLQSVTWRRILLPRYCFRLLRNVCFSVVNLHSSRQDEQIEARVQVLWIKLIYVSIDISMLRRGQQTICMSNFQE